MKDDLKLIVGVFVGFVLIALLIGFVQAKMESDTYNRLTGAHTTWWDACWVELRVMDVPKQRE